MSYYVIRQKHAIPSFLFRAIASWVLFTAVMLIVAIAGWIMNPHAAPEPTTDLSHVLPWPALVDLFVALFYLVFGSFALWVLMWVYWVAVDRAGLASRIFWFFVLFFGLSFGASIYALIVWRRDIERVEGPQPIKENFPVLGVV